MSSLLGVLCRVCWVSYVESAGCLMSSLLGVLLVDLKFPEPRNVLSYELFLLICNGVLLICNGVLEQIQLGCPNGKYGQIS